MQLLYSFQTKTAVSTLTGTHGRRTTRPAAARRRALLIRRNLGTASPLLTADNLPAVVRTAAPAIPVRHTIAPSCAR